jgi:ABC-type sugar transport system ATPase subunit
VASVSFDDVAKVYPDGTRAVWGFDLEISDGEFMVLVGPSGSGKATALQMVACLEEVRADRDPEIARILNELGTTTIYVTHDQIEAMTMGDRVAAMRRGELEQVDTPQQLYDRPANLFVGGFVGSPAMNMVEATLEPSNGTLAAAVGSQRIVLGDEKLNAHPALRASEGRTVILGIRPEDLEDAALARRQHPLTLNRRTRTTPPSTRDRTSERRRDEARCHRRTRLHRIDAR